MRSTTGSLTIDSYLFGQGLGGIIFPPYSESFGRKKLYIVSTGLYAVFCVVVAAVPHLPAVIVGRFMTGFLSSIPTCVVAGSIEDMFASEARVWAIFIYVTLANLGLFLGALLGAYISFTIGW